jgi:hypothetical protein
MTQERRNDRELYAAVLPLRLAAASYGSLAERLVILVTMEAGWVLMMAF